MFIHPLGELAINAWVRNSWYKTLHPLTAPLNSCSCESDQNEGLFMACGLHRDWFFTSSIGCCCRHHVTPSGSSIAIIWVSSYFCFSRVWQWVYQDLYELKMFYAHKFLKPSSWWFEFKTFSSAFTSDFFITSFHDTRKPFDCLKAIQSMMLSWISPRV